ncbi:hypothetical protein ERO13_A04G006780v2 [Gossypium hirsutum]|nr:hypothetical protein ERO13_A04G006780v2 [Gossypium hirsutum]
MASYLFLSLFLFFPHLYASFSSSVSHSCSSLIQFKNSFSITEYASLSCDKSHPMTNSWKEGTDCCSWDGVTCDHLNAHVISLDLSCNWLYGNFPSNTTLFHLPHLHKLNLAYNDFNLSKIPSEFGQFTSLFYLNLSNTGFVGEVPSQELVHNLTEVRHLFLDEINMSSVNAHVFMNLSSFLRSLGNILQLTHLDLSGNQLSGQIPILLGKLIQLTNLDFGQMPRSLGNLLQLTHLYFPGNQLSGQIPISLGKLFQLTHLDLSGNQLSGQIPSSILNLTHLEFLDITGNSFEGSIPDGITAFPNLISLMLVDNLLNGTLPSWLYTAPSLNKIYLSQNQFSGHIKEFQSKSLEYLFLANNKLQGPLPSSISQLLNLTRLFLSSNNLSGVIEFSMFSNLSNLQFLDLSYNSLSLTSNSTSSVNHILPNITILSLSSCNLSEFPQFLKGLKSLESLDLSYNRIEGKIPQWMQEQFPWKNIAVLDLSSNLIRGNLPIPASTINVFLISNNSFNGEVSSLICNATFLQILDLCHNNLSGTIPQCFGNLSNNLEFLNLKKNKFYGTIPPTFAEGCQLSNLNLNGNLLEGPLTPSILNCRGLEVLDLGNNKINDTFPHWLGSLPQLQVLVLKSNHMHGSLCVNCSKSSPFFSKIQIFDLSSNYFSGPLPVRYINSFKAITNLEKIGSTVSYMGFEGKIPKVIGKLNLLKGLNLSHNNLNGGIPTSIGNLTSLEWLDLSSNRLSGTIPNRLVDLPFLSSLNVSENQLHGQIPQGKQFNTFGNDSYEGNKGLCGFPVSKGCNFIVRAPPNVLEKDGSKSYIAFGWIVVLIGYGCGVVFGMSCGYVFFQTGKPRWLVNLVENQHEKRRRRKSKNGNRSNRRRRI